MCEHNEKIPSQGMPDWQPAVAMRGRMRVPGGDGWNVAGWAMLMAVDWDEAISEGGIHAKTAAVRVFNLQTRT